MYVAELTFMRIFSSISRFYIHFAQMNDK